MKTYLLDTDTAIELLRGRNVHVAQQLASRERNRVFLSTVTVAELMFGALRSQESKKNVITCQLFCSAFRLADLGYFGAERSAIVRADLEGRGERIGAYDVLIAGIALAGGHIVVTHNVREFGRVAALEIEDWMAMPKG